MRFQQKRSNSNKLKRAMTAKGDIIGKTREGFIVIADYTDGVIYITTNRGNVIKVFIDPTLEQIERILS